MMLSMPPTQATLSFAEMYLNNLRNPPEPPPVLTWKDILDEEPYEGQHWQGVYGLPPGSTVENWEIHSSESSPSLSPLDDLDDLDDSHSSLASPESSDDIQATVAPDQSLSFPTRDPQVYHYRREFEELQARQYWKADWRMDAMVSRPFDIGDASTLGGHQYDTMILSEIFNIFRTLASTYPQRAFDGDELYTRTRGEGIICAFCVTY
jgi:gamma-tubulin complex component 5